MVIERFGVYIVPLDPSVGSEMQKTRPYVILSPDEMNRIMRTVIISPLTSAQSGLPMRVGSQFAGRTGEVALDHIRTVDKRRLRKHLGTLDVPTQEAILQTLQKMFS
jgi:mRNA interferase MazF